MYGFYGSNNTVARHGLLQVRGVTYKLHLCSFYGLLKAVHKKPLTERRYSDGTEHETPVVYQQYIYTEKDRSGGFVSSVNPLQTLCDYWIIHICKHIWPRDSCDTSK